MRVITGSITASVRFSVSWNGVASGLRLGVASDSGLGLVDSVASGGMGIV